MWEKYFHNLYLSIVNYRPKFMGYERETLGGPIECLNPVRSQFEVISAVL